MLLLCKKTDSEVGKCGLWASSNTLIIFKQLGFSIRYAHDWAKQFLTNVFKSSSVTMKKFEEEI